MAYCSSVSDCEQMGVVFRRAYGCFKRDNICRPCKSKRPTDVVEGCSRSSLWNTTETTVTYDNDPVTNAHDDSCEIFSTIVFWIIALIVLISIFGCVMCCTGHCPGQEREEIERPVQNNATIGKAGYPAYPGYQYGGQYVLVPTLYQTQFAVLTSPPPLYFIDKVPKNQDFPAPKPPPNQNAVAPAPAPAVPKSENNAQDDIVIRLKVEVPEKSQEAA